MTSNLDIQVDADVVARLVDHLRNGTTDLADEDLFVPISHFTDPARAQAEIALLKRLPLLVAHRSELPQPGDFVTREILGMPLIIARQDDGSVRAYLNMCRHRGGRVEQDASGNKRIFMCRYHGWSFEREGGALRNVPYEQSYGPIDRAESALISFRAEEYHGLIYVDFSNDATRTLTDWFGPQVDAQIAPWGLADSQIVIDKTFTMDINWKLVMDGAIDIIHPRFLHQNGVGKLIETNVGVFRQYGPHGKHFGARTKLRTLAEQGDALALGSKYIGSNLVLYPNAMMIGAPEHVEFWTVWPSLESPTRSTVQIRFLVRSEILDEHIEKRVHKSWEILEQAATQEDWPMERWIQQNAQAWPHGVYRYGRSELACAHLHRQLARDLDGAR